MARTTIIGLATMTILCIPAIAAAADPAAAPDQGTARPADSAAITVPEGFHYGPILARDAVTRGEIKRLYREQWEYNRDATARLQEVTAAAAAEPDPDLRAVLERDAFGIKQATEIRNVELGLEIARLNGDALRVADFERALDQLLNPDKYRPAPLDPSIGEQRARDMGLR
jgi:hypothetical protein